LCEPYFNKFTEIILKVNIDRDRRKTEAIAKYRETTPTLENSRIFEKGEYPSSDENVFEDF